ncbi:hypothetical protein PHYPSEUDO_011738 [Phytophthora pseudosyringae]|uniref:Uncharacterized protein n=1 Tax=Phytophthora pseudosyringae TaxID=221518 RepID=A0A8T1V7Z6_9STRA|nr:hypothetical protein PHYPSEUDO_011738 [Phytophthora pseudosyringae]
MSRPAPAWKARSVSHRLVLSTRRFLSGLINSKSAVTALALPSPAFRLVWMVVVGAHLLCAAFLAGCAATYSYLTNPIMAYYVQLWSPTKGNENYGLYSVICAVVSGTHALRVLQLLHRSLVDRQLVFRRRRRKSRGSSSVEEFSRSTPRGPSIAATVRKVFSAPAGVASLSRSQQQRVNKTFGSLKLGWRALFSRSGLFGVESQHFLTVFVVREVVELATQTYQAHRSSHLLPRLWLNDILVAMLVLNCWSTLAVQQFLRHNAALERVVALFADAFICITMVIVVPVTVFAPYASAFDLPNHRFGPAVSFYDPVFMAIFVLEAQLVLASSSADFGAKLIPHFAIYLALVNISGLVTRKRIAVASEPTKIQTTVKVSSVAKAPGIPRIPEAVSSTDEKLSQFNTFSWINKALQTAFGLWGFVILALHGHAMIVAHSTLVHGCRASTRPWLTSRISCSSLVVNCYKYGTESVNGIIFEQIDTSVLATLTLAHCPALTMPLALPRFDNLMILHVYNSTVVSWGSQESAFSNPRLSTLIVARSNVSSSSAQGMMLPMSLSTVQFCGTDLAVIPGSLPWSVHPMAVVAFDFGELTALPASLMSLQAFAVSLKGNRLETVPQLAAMPPGQMFYGLELNNNPLRELPATLGSPTNFFITLDLQNTNVTTLPAWTLAQVLGVIYMHGTPYCANISPELQQQNAICFPRPATDPGMQLAFDIFSVMYAYERD